MMLKGVDSTSQTQLCTSVQSMKPSQSLWLKAAFDPAWIGEPIWGSTRSMKLDSFVPLVSLVSLTSCKNGCEIQIFTVTWADSTSNSPLLLHKATLTRGWWCLTISCEVALGQEAATCQAILSASLEQLLNTISMDVYTVDTYRIIQSYQASCEYRCNCQHQVTPSSLPFGKEVSTKNCRQPQCRVAQLSQGSQRLKDLQDWTCVRNTLNVFMNHQGEPLLSTHNIRLMTNNHIIWCF